MIALNVRNLVIARGVKPRDVCSYLRSLDISEKVAKGIASGSRKSLNLNQVEILCYKLKVVPNDLYLWSVVLLSISCCKCNTIANLRCAYRNYCFYKSTKYFSYTNAK